MSRICEVTGKKKQKGNQVSHAMNHTRKFFQPNLHKKRFWIPEEKRWVTLKVSGAVSSLSGQAIQKPATSPWA